MSDPVILPSPANSGPASAESFQTAALESIRNQGKSAPAAPEAPKSTPSKGLDEKKLDVVSDVARPAEAPEKAPSDSIAKSFEKLAREKAAIRQEQESVRQAKAHQDRLGPQGMHKLLQAQERGDVKAIIEALGVKPEGIKFEDQPQEEVSEVAALKARLEAFETQVREERNQQGRAKVLDLTKEMAAKSHPLVSEMGAHDRALKAVEEYVRANGEMPAETREESLRIGLDYVEAQLAEEAARWEKALTKRKGPATIAPVETVEQESPAVSPVASRSLAQTTSPSAVRPTETPKTQDEYIAATLAAIKQLPQP